MKLGAETAASVGTAGEAIVVTEEVIVAIEDIIAGTLDGLIAITVDITIYGILAAATIPAFILHLYIRLPYILCQPPIIVKANAPIGLDSANAIGIPVAISLAACGIKAATRT